MFLLRSNARFWILFVSPYLLRLNNEGYIVVDGLRLSIHVQQRWGRTVRQIGRHGTSSKSAKTITLLAKKGGRGGGSSKKKNRGTASGTSGAGFGSKNTAAATLDRNKKVVAQKSDYAVFPALDPSVKETLVPRTSTALIDPNTTSETEGFSDEIYQRLHQIYGFSRFNFAANSDGDDVDGMASGKGSASTAERITDLLSSLPDTDSRLVNPTRDVTSSSSPTLLGSSELDSLLASVTGASTSSVKVAEVHDDEGKDDAASDDHTNSESESLLRVLQALPPFGKFRVLHVDPLVIAVDDFFTPDECDRYIEMSSNSDSVMERQSPTVGKDAVAMAQRTSTTWYHHFKNVPELIAKATRLLGIDTIDRWEEPQTVRYRCNEKFTWHLDALGPSESDPQKGGQRIATLLVYLNDLQPEQGGATVFRDLVDEEVGDHGVRGRLRVRPRKGTALLFFPAAGGINGSPIDIRTLHCGEVVVAGLDTAPTSSLQDDVESIQKEAGTTTSKWISQLWLREGSYTPTAPPGNQHKHAMGLLAQYCREAFSP